MKNIILAFVLLSFSLQGCHKEVSPEVIAQSVVFEYEFVNHAWIYTHFGWMLDENGGLHQYSRNDEWKEADAEGFISKQDLNFNLGLTDTVLFTVEKDDLLRYFEDRFAILNLKFDTADQHSADAGIGAMYLYVWDSQKSKYKKQLLATKGDVELSPTDTKAKNMVQWLQAIGKQTDRFFWGF